jgi:hypothetical protein
MEESEMQIRAKFRARRRATVLAFLLALTLALAGSGLAQQGPPQGGPPQGGGRPPAGEDKPFEDVVKDMEVIEGLFTFYYKADDNKYLIELRPEQVGPMFLFSMTADRAVGERGLYSSQMAGQGAVYFRRIGKTVQMMLKNARFTAEPGTPQARAADRSFTDSLLGSARVQSKPHPERGSILLDAADLLLTDLPAMAPRLSQVYQPTNYRFDKANSAMGPVRAFPGNVLLEVWLHYATDNPRAQSVALAERRSIPIVMKYDLSELKQTGYRPRRADPRVGHFLTIHQDFTSDRPASPFVRNINRWHLEKADPRARVSPPKEPIVFWLENTIPAEYREWFKQGVLLWNDAFERIGFRDAIVVKQMPDDADWDPADTRYNTIRWFAGVDASFAIGPSRANPFTGQIYDADIGFSEGIIRSARRAAQEFATPVVGMEAGQWPAAEEFSLGLPGMHPGTLCTYGADLAMQAALGLDVLEARGELTPELENRLMREYIIEVTAHEVDHTLGFRHNFRASTILSVDELFDTERTGRIGQSGSVMDYNPVVIADRGRKQGQFLMTRLGPYDYWAVEYAYKPIDGDEEAELSRIASRVADPMLAYATDEDALGTFSPMAIDPLANQFDQSSDPLAYFRQRLTVVNELWDSMEEKLVRPGEGYQVLRRAVSRSVGEYNRALLTSSKFIGGIYHHRDHAGDPDGRLPYVPVPAAKQREALDFLRTHAFSEKAFVLPPGVYNKLAAERLPGLGGIGQLMSGGRIEFPWHDTVLGLQRGVLSRLYHPVTLARIQDNELRFAAGEQRFTLADLFTGLRGAIWSELEGSPARISSLRRNLQREHTNQLIRLVLRPAPSQASGGDGPFGGGAPQAAPRPPEDATTLARASLVQIQSRIRRTLAAGTVTDTTTRAHLEETQQRISAALAAQMAKSVE